ncbi:MAG: hypothetical protein IT214_08985 [Chitinophagaceae bacterium]|jgi:hypothetical protein|nr:hypothetical protein [Chitinophagaceae bacterium]OQY94755.1 MAG: hypothetical protein B6D37_07830 [Sphingobacteriales bacterium UTBCD1]
MDFLIRLFVLKFFITAIIIFPSACFCGKAQKNFSSIDSFRVHGDIKVTIDRPRNFSSQKETIVTFFALPNGSTTEQTMGRRMKEGDDWHFDIQHIRAQTSFIRKQLKKKNFIVIYLENNYKSWPSWKQKHPEFRDLIPHLVDSLSGLTATKNVSIYLNGHSGGGSFIFGYLAGVKDIPSSVKRISFLDSDYGYENSYCPEIISWLRQVKGSALNVFAYNDSVALYNGKPVVSDTGGTWYRSHLFLQDLQKEFSFSEFSGDSMIVYKTKDRRIQFYFKTNPEQKIFHTQQVELNGFIHSVLCGTKYESKKYRYYASRAYEGLIEQ